MAYILIIITFVHNGSTVAMQEFNSKATCEAAAHTIITGERRTWAPIFSYCVPK